MQSNNTGKTYSPEKSMAIARQAARSAVSNGHISIFKIMDSYQIGRNSAKLLFNSLIVCGIIDHSGTSLIRKESEIPETLSRLHFQFLDPEGEWQRQTQVRLGLEGGNSELQEEMKAYYLAEHDHIRNFNLWRKENLDPQVMILAGMAATDPQYDGNYLYRLERQKLICMRTYFSNCRFTKEGIDRRNYWIDICIRLLMYIENNGIDIPDESIRKMNIRNIADLKTDKDALEEFSKIRLDSQTSEEDKDWKYFYGRKIYARKMERLYHQIRLDKTSDWWE